MKRLFALLIAVAAFATACQGNVFELGVGDCFNNPDNRDEVADVEMVDCSELHDNEVYSTFNIPGSSFPGQNSVQNSAAETCLATFEGFVGRDYGTSALEISALTPTSESWDQGDQEVVCFLFNVDGAKRSGTAKDSGI